MVPSAQNQLFPTLRRPSLWTAPCVTALQYNAYGNTYFEVQGWAFSPTYFKPINYFYVTFTCRLFWMKQMHFNFSTKFAYCTYHRVINFCGHFIEYKKFFPYLNMFLTPKIKTPQPVTMNHEPYYARSNLDLFW